MLLNKALDVKCSWGTSLGDAVRPYLLCVCGDPLGRYRYCRLTALTKATQAIPSNLKVPKDTRQHIQSMERNVVRGVSEIPPRACPSSKDQLTAATSATQAWARR